MGGGGSSLGFRALGVYGLGVSGCMVGFRFRGLGFRVYRALVV